MKDIKHPKMTFVCNVNPKAGKDDAVLKLVKDSFGQNANIMLLEELADIFIICAADADVLDKLKKIQESTDVWDTQIEIVRTHTSVEKEVRFDNIYIGLIDIEPGQVQKFIDALRIEVDKVVAGNIELLYVGEIFSPRADVIAMIGTNTQRTWEISQRLRSLPGVEDTTIYKLRHTGEIK
jgi:hypothetical protein